MTKIAYLSDIHSEFYEYQEDWLPPLPIDTDVLILAGDIGIGSGTVEFINRVARSLPNCHIVWVAGNHEFYGSNIDTLIDGYQQHYQDCEHIHFLENSTATIKGIRFIGCTLWSNFSCLGTQLQLESKSTAQRSINDFRRIRCNKGSDPFTTDDAARRHDESNLFIERELEAVENEKVVVITHFSPSPRLIHPEFGENILTPYFSSDCEDLIKRYQPNYWIYGHNHWSDNIKIGSTIIASNQLGYPEEHKLENTFNSKAIFSI